MVGIMPLTVKTEFPQYRPESASTTPSSPTWGPGHYEYSPVKLSPEDSFVDRFGMQWFAMPGPGRILDIRRAPWTTIDHQTFRQLGRPYFSYRYDSPLPGYSKEVFPTYQQLREERLNQLLETGSQLTQNPVTQAGGFSFVIPRR